MTKEKIIEVTAGLLKSEGIKGITTRKIADLAGTNIASINYYFGSKEKLINEILRTHLESFRVAFDLLDQQETPALARLKNFLLLYTTLIQEHPELAQSIMSPEELFESHAQYADFMKNQGFGKLIQTINEIVGPADSEKSFVIITQMLSAIFFPIVSGSFANPALTDKIQQDKYSIEETIEIFLEFYFNKFNVD